MDRPVGQSAGMGQDAAALIAHWQRRRTNHRAHLVAPSQAIYADSLNAYSDPRHRCHVFRNLQHGVPDNLWQLPEPFNGCSARSSVVFLGLNPSYNPSESVPTIDTPFEAWDQYYRRRLDTDIAIWPLLYRRYQSVGEVAVGAQFRLGRDALVVEIVRFRSEKGEGISDAVLANELPITRQILADVAPDVIVAVGSDVLWQLRRMYTELTAPLFAHTVQAAVASRLDAGQMGVKASR